MIISLSKNSAKWLLGKVTLGNVILLELLGYYCQVTNTCTILGFKQLIKAFFLFSFLIL